MTLTPAQRASLPLALIRELDRSVFRKRWDGLRRLAGEGEGEGEGLPDGIEVVWNKRLRNTAGRASWKRCVISQRLRSLNAKDSLRLSDPAVHLNVPPAARARRSPARLPSRSARSLSFRLM